MANPNIQISRYKFYALIVLQEALVGRDDKLSTGSHHVIIKSEDIKSRDKDKRTFFALPTKMDGVGGSYIRCLSIDKIDERQLNLILSPETRNDFSNIHIWICQIPEKATYYEEGCHVYSNIIVFQNEIKQTRELGFLKKRNQEVQIKKEEHMKILAIDFETSQAFGHPRACQIGLTPIENGIIKETKSYLIKPPHNAYDNYTITKHHITPEMTKNSPTFGELWPIIKKYFDEAEFLIAHNASTERNVLINEFSDYNLGTMSYKIIDTLELYKKKFNQNEQKYRLGLEYICNAFGINTDNHHDAGDDSRNCAIIYLNYVNGIEPDMKVLSEHTYRNSNSGQFQSKEELSLNDFIDTSSIKEITDSCLSGKRIIVTREFTIFGHESKNSEDIIREYLHLKFGANTKKGDVNGTTDYVFVGKVNNQEDWGKGKLKNIRKFKEKGTLKGVFYQEDIDKLLEGEHNIALK